MILFLSALAFAEPAPTAHQRLYLGAELPVAAFGTGAEHMGFVFDAIPVSAEWMVNPRQGLRLEGALNIAAGYGAQIDGVQGANIELSAPHYFGRKAETHAGAGFYVGPLLSVEPGDRAINAGLSLGYSWRLTDNLALRLGVAPSFNVRDGSMPRTTGAFLELGGFVF